MASASLLALATISAASPLGGVVGGAFGGGLGDAIRDGFGDGLGDVRICCATPAWLKIGGRYVICIINWVKPLTTYGMVFL